MNRFLEWVLDLDRINVGGDAPVSISLQTPWPGWLLLAGGIAALAFVIAIYRREEARTGVRIWLAGLRVLLIGLLVLILSEPILVLSRDRRETACTVLMIDTTLSMSLADQYQDPAEARGPARALGLMTSNDTEPGEDVLERLARFTRWDVLTAALSTGQGAPVRSLLANNTLRVYSYAASAEPQSVISREDQLPDVDRWLAAAQPTGLASNLPTAIQNVFEDLRGVRLAALVVAGDGRDTELSPLQNAVDTARGLQVPIHVIPIGSTLPPQDISIGPVRAEPKVFIKDLIAIRAAVSAQGFAEPTLISVVLRREGESATLATATIQLGGGKNTGEVELRARADRPGRFVYVVEAKPTPREVSTDNNLARVAVDVLGDRLKVLYVEGYPRFEYRYLKNMLLREESVISSCLLLSADEGFAQEGDEPIRRFPETADELNQYDVVVFGDVDPRADWLTTAQMNMLVDFVGRRGGGFALIAGERFAPQRFRRTPLEKLIPVKIDPQVSPPPGNGLYPFIPRLTVEGRHRRIFRFVRDPEENARIMERLPAFYWMARTLGPRPGAEVLAERPESQTPSDPLPLVVIGHYGAGMTLFHATDDTWRWRRHTGESLYDTYWLQVFRALTQSSRLGIDQLFSITTDRREYEYSQPVRITVEVLETSLLAAVDDSLGVLIADADDVPVARVDLPRRGQSTRTYEGLFVPPRAGSFALRVDSPLAVGLRNAPAALIRVDPPNTEMRNLSADHASLRRLAEQTGGKVIAVDRLAAEFAKIPNRSVSIPDDISEPLWDTKLVLTIFVLIILMEWVVRKAFGLA